MSTDPRPLPPLPPITPLPSLEYADARPNGSQLHCETAGDRLRVWRDPPGRDMLVAEFVLPVVSFVFLGGWIAVIAVMMARAGLAGLPELVRARSFAGLSHILQIRRRGGPALGAFSRCRREEVAWAADAIRAALGLVD